VRERNPQQTPRKWASDVEGAVVIAANPNPLEAPLPEDLQAAIDSFVAEIREKAIPRLDKLLRGKHRGLALSANKTLLTLATDDSRRVSAAAELCLSAFQRDRAAGVIRTDRFEALPIPASVLPVKPDSARPDDGKVENPHVPNEDSAAAKASPSLHSMAEHAKPIDDGRRALDKQPAEQVSAEISHSSARVSAHLQVPAHLLSDPAPDIRTEPAPAVGLPSRKWSSDDERSAQLRSFGKSLAAKVAEDDALKRYVAAPASTRTPASGGRPFSRSILLGAGALITILAFAAIVWWAFVPKHASSETGALTATVAKPDQPKPEQPKPDKPATDQKSVQPAADTVQPIPSPVEVGTSPLRESNSPVSETSSSRNISPRQRETPSSKASASSAVDTSRAPPSASPVPYTSPSQSSPSPALSISASNTNNEPPAGAVAEPAPSKQPSKVVESSDFSPAMHAVPPSLHVTLTPEQAKALLLSRSPAKYPEVARAAGVTGTVVVHTHVSRMGTVQRLEILDGPPLLRQAALDALKSWRFKPYLVNGDPVEWRTTINIGFNLNKE